MFNIILPKIKFKIEKWKLNKNYNIYVSDLGNFKDKFKDDIKLKVDRSGYLMVPVCNNKRGIIKYIPAHRIVMETWCPRADMWKAKLTVDHLDHNKRNNTYRNLEWVTKEENLRRASIDFLFDDKDKIIQSLQDKIKNLENNTKTKITIIGIKNFENWDEVIEFLIQRGKINDKNYKKENIIKRIQKASKNHTSYCNYNWKIN